MLSQDLRFLRAWWDEVVEGRAEFTLKGAKEFSSQLGLAVEAAAAMENVCIDAGALSAEPESPPLFHDESEELPPNVVRMKLPPRLAEARAKP